MEGLGGITGLRDEMTRWRRHIHQNPELGFEEFATSEFVTEKLCSFGIEVRRGLASTGVVGRITGKQAGSAAIGLRADMDALPIEEETNLPHHSKNTGKMHACGHDGHLAMLLGAASYLGRTRNFAGTVYLIFQPAEEEGGGGLAMIEEGLFEKCPMGEVFGLHNWPGLAAGQFAVRSGPVMAASDRFDIEVQGVGCHAGMPHNGRDPSLSERKL